MDITQTQLREKYLKSEPMDTREQTYAAIRKALATLDDPFTRFLEPARYAALRRGTAGAAVVGVGLEVGFGDKGKLVVSMGEGLLAVRANGKCSGTHCILRSTSTVLSNYCLSTFTM